MPLDENRDRENERRDITVVGLNQDFFPFGQGVTWTYPTPPIQPPSEPINSQNLHEWGDYMEAAFPEPGEPPLTPIPGARNRFFLDLSQETELLARLGLDAASIPLLSFAMDAFAGILSQRDTVTPFTPEAGHRINEGDYNTRARRYATGYGKHDIGIDPQKASLSFFMRLSPELPELLKAGIAVQTSQQNAAGKDITIEEFNPPYKRLLEGLCIKITCKTPHVREYIATPLYIHPRMSLGYGNDNFMPVTDEFPSGRPSATGQHFSMELAGTEFPIGFKIGLPNDPQLLARDFSAQFIWIDPRTRDTAA